MSELTETYYPTTTFDASPATLPREGEGLVDQDEHTRVVADLRTMDGWLADAQREIDRLRAELAKRDETIATSRQANEHLKRKLDERDERIEELHATVHRKNCDVDKLHGLRSEAVEKAADLSAKLRNLQANLDAAHRELASLREHREGRDTYAGMLQADVHAMVHAADDLAGQLSEAKATITSLRAQLARAEAIEEATRALRAHLRPRGGHRWAADAEAALSRVDAALVSPSPRDTAEGERPSVHPLTRIVIEEISPGLWKPSAWEGDHRLVSWEASTREGAAENVLAGMASRDSYQGIKL